MITRKSFVTTAPAPGNKGDFDFLSPVPAVIPTMVCREGVQSTGKTMVVLLRSPLCFTLYCNVCLGL